MSASSTAEAPSTPIAAAGDAGKGGRPPSELRKEEFNETGPKVLSCKRHPVQCKHCLKHYSASAAKIEDLRQHILFDCNSVPDAIRKKWVSVYSQGLTDKKDGEVAAAEGKVGRKRKAATAGSSGNYTIQRWLPGMQQQLKKGEVEQVSEHLTRWSVMHNIPSRAFERPHFLSAVTVLRPGTCLPSSTTFRGPLLTKEFLAVKAKLKEKIQASENLTLTVDGWTNARKQSVLAFVLLFPDRTSMLLETKELSAESHTAETIADLIIKVISAHGIRQKLALLVTDNAANMLKARQIVVQTDGLLHVLEMRCAMHGFNLVLGSILSHPWAQEVITKSQSIVTYFRASHQPLAFLRAAAKQCGVKQELQSSNKTRFTSKHMCTSSVQANAPAFNVLLGDATQAAAIRNPDVLAVLEDNTYWNDLKKLNRLQEPLTQVIMAVQRGNATMADVCRYWLYLAHHLGTQLDSLPLEYQSHIMWAFSKRARQQDMPLCRLALYLDPRFRQAASKGIDSMAELVTKAAEYAHSQGYDAETIQLVLAQLAAYGRAKAPFHLPTTAAAPGAQFSCKDWWSTVAMDAGGAALAELALVLLDVVPHAAEPERVFSKMGWYEGRQSNRLSVLSNSKKTTIKLYYEGLKPAATPSSTRPAAVCGMEVCAWSIRKCVEQQPQLNPGPLVGDQEGDSGIDAAVAKEEVSSTRPTNAQGSNGSRDDQTVAAVTAAAAASNVEIKAERSSPPADSCSFKEGDPNAAAAPRVSRAWCPNPANSFASADESYHACVILARQPNGRRIPWCTAFFVISPGSVNNIAISAGHCVSDGNGNFILDINNYGNIDQDSIMCCAYDQANGQGACPTAYSYKIRTYKLYDSYHNGNRRSHDMAVLSVENSPTGRIPGKWRVDNWDPDSGSRDWWVYGYPQYDSRYDTCRRDFFGRRWSWGLNAPVLRQPTSTVESYLYGSSCGGLSGAPTIDSRRNAVTSVLVASDLTCDGNGWGRIYTTAIRGIPGGSPGLGDVWSGVDVYGFWQGF
eukprot:gene3312-3588_t